MSSNFVAMNNVQSSITRRSLEITKVERLLSQHFHIVRSTLDAAHNVITAQMTTLSAVSSVPRSLLKLVDNIVQLFVDLK